MLHIRLARHLFNVPLLVTPDRASELQRAFRAHEEGLPALLAPPIEVAPRPELLAPGYTRADAGYVRTEQDVAIIEVIGTLVQRGDSMDAQSGLIGYNRIANQLHAAVNDPRVIAIMLELDSPGGEANGVIDLAGKIRAAAQRKPLYASANERAYSGAFWLGSAALNLTAPTTAMVGSIGVVMLHVDQSQRDAKQGLVYTPIIAGARKADFSSHAPLSDAALATAQEEVDRLYEMFTSAVAEQRGIDQQVVIDTEAALLNPHKALSIGLIDGVQSFEEALAALAAEGRNARHGMRVAARGRNATTTLEAEMARQGEDWETILQQRAAEASALNLQGANIMAGQENSNAATAAQIAEARAAGVAEGKAAAAAEAEAAKAKAAAEANKPKPEAVPDAGAAAKAAVEADRKRVVAIQTCEAAKGKPALAAHLALETDMTVEQASAMLAKAGVEAPAKPTNLFAAHMDALGNPKLASDAATGAGGDDAAISPALANVIKLRNDAVQAAAQRK